MPCMLYTSVLAFSSHVTVSDLSGSNNISSVSYFHFHLLLAGTTCVGTPAVLEIRHRAAH